MTDQIPAEDVRRLRRMTGEMDVEHSPYTDAILIETIKRNEGNLYWSASEICCEKASQVASQFDFSADGGSYHRNELSAKWLKLAHEFEQKGGKRNGGTIRLWKWPVEPQRINVLDNRIEWDA